jgi:hypothetical protein
MAAFDFWGFCQICRSERYRRCPVGLEERHTNRYADQRQLVRKLHLSVYPHWAEPWINHSVTLSRQIGTGTDQIIQKVVYTYYTDQSAYGNARDLEMANVIDPNGNVLQTWYFRYYKQDNFISNTANQSADTGYKDGLKFVFDPQSFARLRNNFLIPNPDSSSDASIARFAMYKFQYDSSHRVASVAVQGAGGATTGGLGTYRYAYETSSFAAGYGDWNHETIETKPDGSRNIVFTNSAGEVMLDSAEVGSGDATQKWIDYYQYDSQGRLVLHANPSAVSGYDASFADPVLALGGDLSFLSQSTGLIQLWDYYQATQISTGQVQGYLQDTKIRRAACHERQRYAVATSAHLTGGPLGDGRRGASAVRPLPSGCCSRRASRRRLRNQSRLACAVERLPARGL